MDEDSSGNLHESSDEINYYFRNFQFQSSELAKDVTMKWQLSDMSLLALKEDDENLMSQTIIPGTLMIQFPELSFRYEPSEQMH